MIETSMSLVEMILFIVFMSGFLISGVILIIMVAFTPAWSFLMAKINSVPMILTKYKDSFGAFKRGTKPRGGVTKCDGLPVLIENNSFILEKKSKVPIYFRFQDHGVVSNQEYIAVIKELKEMGFTINTISDLREVILLSRGEIDKTAYLAKIKDPQRKAIMEKRLHDLNKLEIEISPYKTYNLPDLKDMFPFNINAEYTEAYAEEEVNMAIKRVNRNAELYKLLLMAAIIIGICGMVLIIFFTVWDPAAKQVVCDCATTGVKNAYTP